MPATALVIWEAGFAGAFLMAVLHATSERLMSVRCGAATNTSAAVSAPALPGGALLA